MRRRIGRTAALLLLAASVVTGTAAGLTANAVSGPAPDPASAPGSDGHTPRPTTDGGLLGADNLLATTDFETIGWPELAIEALANGEPQFAYACQRSSLSHVALLSGTVSVDWGQASSLTAAETVTQVETPPQAGQLYRRVSGWYRDCTSGTGKQQSALVTSVDTDGGTAEVWRIGGGAAEHAAYGVLARSGDRIGMVDVYGDATPVDPQGLRDLAARVVQRLG